MGIRAWVVLLLLLPGVLWAQSLRFSLHGGWYEQPVVLSLEADGAVIYYTLNGATPRPGRDVWRGEMTLRQSAVVRAIACRDGRCSPEQAHTFLIGEPRSAFPTVSVALPPDVLFHPGYGLFREGGGADRSSWKRPGANFWSKKEVVCHVEIFDAWGDPVYHDHAGFRIFGGMSRLFPQKSFSLTARERYGDKRIRYPVFGKEGPKKFKSLVFRNGGSDWGEAQFRDALMTGLLDGWDLEKQDHQPCHVYINGRYWGLYNIREKINRFFIEEASGADKDSIDLLEHNAHVKKGSAAHYLRMLDFIRRHDLKEDSHFAAVARMMDVDNFMHYQIAQIYFDNKDAGGNIRFWRPRRPDGRWRWILYDVDQGFGLHDPLAYMENTLAFHLEPNGPSWPNPPWSTFLLRNLLKNDAFRQNFIRTFFEVLNADFSPERVEARIRDFAGIYRPEIPRHFGRWHIRPEKWEEQLVRMAEFARQRPAWLRRHLQEYFSLGALAEVTFGATEGGTLRIGGRMGLEADSATGVYPAGMPLHLEVRPRPGYRFAGWEGWPGRDWEIRAMAGQLPPRIKAVFEPYRHPMAERVMINEVGAYNPGSGDWVEIYNASDQPVDLTSWILADARHQYRLPTAVIPPGGYQVFCRDLPRFKRHFPGVPAAAGHFGFGFHRQEESVYLYGYDGAYVDSIRYCLEPQEGIFTLSLVLPGLDNADPRNWEVRSGPGTPGAGNPHFVESHIRAKQAIWTRIGLVTAGLSLLLALLGWRWRHRKTIQEDE